MNFSEQIKVLSADQQRHAKRLIGADIAAQHFMSSYTGESTAAYIYRIAPTSSFYVKKRTAFMSPPYVQLALRLKGKPLDPQLEGVLVYPPEHTRAEEFRLIGTKSIRRHIRHNESVDRRNALTYFKRVSDLAEHLSQSTKPVLTS